MTGTKDTPNSLKWRDPSALFEDECDKVDWGRILKSGNALPHSGEKRADEEI